MSFRYDEHGNEYRIVDVNEGQCLAWLQVLSENDETFDGELRIVQESTLHTNPPRQKINNQIVELQATLEDLRQQILARKRDLQDFENGYDDRMARLKQHESLRRLDDFIAGQITHYVEISYGPPTIVSFEDAKTDDATDKRDKLKLLTLFGRTNGNLEWGLNRYSDGSGPDATVFPCTSYDEAVEVAGKLFAEHAEKALAPDNRTYPRRDWVEQASEYGITMTPDYLRQLQEQGDTAKTERIAELESQIKTLRGEATDDAN